jgi:thiamine-monophosphate kinase
MTSNSPLGPGREFDLIRRFFPLPAHNDVVIGTGDDAAVLRGGWVISTDASVEHIHFRRDWLSAREIGYRSAAVALSDLAAMAAAPVALLVSLILPAADYGTFAEQIMAGVADVARRFGAALAGGDTTRTDGPLVLDVVALGHTEQPVLRSGARVGDEVWVTGKLGGAALAVRELLQGRTPEPIAQARYAQPEPRVREALWLAQHLDVHALIDLSDGLASDAAHLATASNVALRIEAKSIPIHCAEQAQIQALSAPGFQLTDSVRNALTGGDDYELCFTASPGTVQQMQQEFEHTFRVPLSRIGSVSAGQGIEIVDENGNRVEEMLSGYDHFGSIS